MKPKALLCYVLFFCASCATRKLQVQTTTIDINTGAKVKANSIAFERGKICYVYSTQYNDQTINTANFKNVSNSSSFPANGWSESPSFYGSATSLSKIDTIINDNRIVRIALTEVLKNCPQGFQYEFVPQEVFIDSLGTPNTAIVHHEFNPDIIINLKSLSLNLKGDANIATNAVHSTPGNTDIGTYSSTTPYANYYGNILMDYIAVWEVQNLKENKTKNIKQSGRYVSGYHEGYSLQKEIVICSQKIGQEFSSLVKGSNRTKSL